MSLELIIKFLGILLGVLARTLLPWLRKLRGGRIQHFNKRYFYSALASFILGFILTLVIFPQFDVAGTAENFDAYFKLFCLAFGFGFGWNALLLEGGQWAGAFKNSKKNTGQDK
jgi:H+/Cl- antiporter ClcA